MDPLQGTLDMLVLRTLLLSTLHGYGIAKAIQNTSASQEIEFGSLYPARTRLESKGWIASRWETSEHSRINVDRTTAAEGKQLTREHSKWAEFVSAVTRVMGPAPEAAE